VALAAPVATLWECTCSCVAVLSSSLAEAPAAGPLRLDRLAASLPPPPPTAACATVLEFCSSNSRLKSGHNEWCLRRGRCQRGATLLLHSLLACSLPYAERYYLTAGSRALTPPRHATARAARDNIPSNTSLTAWLRCGPRWAGTQTPPEPLHPALAGGQSS
jgi:hypothetical protein